MKTDRPINLDLTTMRFPAMAIASILHRLSGIGIFILLPFMLVLLHRSLSGAEGFANVVQALQMPSVKCFILLFVAAMGYHIIAGLRHIMMDMGFGEHLQSSRRSAMISIILAALLTIMTGIWLW